jgi:[NiFe] hydrogenase assembly HybE family chaperone
MVLEDPGSENMAETARLDALSAKLVAEFREIWHAKMRDLPMVNKLLSVEAVGFRIVDGRPLGVLISPWFMNLIQLPAEDEEWSNLVPGAKELIAFPSGEYEFIHNTRDLIGGYKACSLFSPMGDFSTQMQAQEVARAVMVALFDEGNRAETDRAADIRAEREAALAQVEEDDVPILTDVPTRRAVISGGLADTR